MIVMDRCLYTSGHVVYVDCGLPPLVLKETAMVFQNEKKVAYVMYGLLGHWGNLA